ncbi:hypothetical protein B0E33_30790 (plasmid) [Roseibium algicola]|uniref:Uncharacterized protein n=1 Tax=Roseibium algicola TaxID=2857014 RepID=A0ABN4X335_9HYPH|nr:hypothetical protein B0E33_30790 [Roseibium aggregatum]
MLRGCGNPIDYAAYRGFEFRSQTLKGKKRRGIAHRYGQVWIREPGGHADLRLVLHEGATPACRWRE